MHDSDENVVLAGSDIHPDLVRSGCKDMEVRKKKVKQQSVATEQDAVNGNCSVNGNDRQAHSIKK